MVTRRDVLVGGLAASAMLAAPEAMDDGFSVPVCRAQSGPAPRPRQDLGLFAQSDAQISALLRAVTLMKLKRPSDPTSWFFQAAVHGVSDAALERATAQDKTVTPDFAALYWNKCPHGAGVRSADFLVWHRAYLFHFEQIVRQASGDPGFSLPYWNYLDPDQRSFPALFSAGIPDPRGHARNPLYESRRNPQTTTLGSDYEFNLDGVPPLDPFAPGAMFGALPGLTFGGAVDSEDAGEGFLESGLHDTIHFGIGGPNGLMSDVQSAAFDPVFWVHHANIDRIWTVFDCLPNKTWGTPPNAAWLNERPWLFYDADMGGVRNEPRSFYLHRGNLNVRYDSDLRGCRPLSDRPLRQGQTVAVLGTGGRRFMQSLNNAAMPGMALAQVAPAPAAGPAPAVPADAAAPAAVTPNGTGRVAIAADQPTTARLTEAVAPSGLTNLQAALGEHKATAAPRRVVLEFTELALTRLPNVRYRVFVNYPGEHVTPGDRDAYVGTLAIFGVFKGPDQDGGPARVTEHGAHRTTQRFDITTRVSGLADPSAIKVAVVPESLLKPLGGAAALPPEGDLTITGFRVIVT